MCKIGHGALPPQVLNLYAPGQTSVQYTRIFQDRGVYKYTGLLITPLVGGRSARKIVHRIFAALHARLVRVENLLTVGGSQLE